MCRINLNTCLVISAFWIGMVGTTFAGQIIYVDTNATGNNDGSTWPDAYNFLQDALTAAISGNEIWVAEGTYMPDANSADTNGSGDREAIFQLRNGVAIYGGFPSGGSEWDSRDPNEYETKLSGDLDGNDIGNLDDPSRNENSYHVVTGSGTGAPAVLDGFTINGGNANGAGFPKNLGGGMYNDAGTPTVANCVFSDNSAGSLGGGMYNNNCSDLTITNCTFTGNSTGSNGGGMYNGNSILMMTNCIFISNLANLGGGMYNTSSSPNLANCTFNGNSAYDKGGGMYNTSSSNSVLTSCTFSENSAAGSWGGGGGMYNAGSSPTLINCTFYGNSATTAFEGGGGMFNANSDPNITNCTFSGNWATGSFSDGGGGMYNSSSSPNVTNCTFSANWGENNGGGVYNSSSSSSPTITNCIFWGNSDLGGIDESAQIHGGTPVVCFSDIHGLDIFAECNNINADPLFVDIDGPDNIVGTKDDNLRLSVGSPCIDAGDNNSVPEDCTDLNGDGDTTEPIPWDFDGNLRLFDDPCTPDTGKGTPPIVDMGAYEVSEPSGYKGVCGDADHPYPMGDLNFDCKVDFLDIALVANNWLAVTEPEL